MHITLWQSEVSLKNSFDQAKHVVNLTKVPNRTLPHVSVCITQSGQDIAKPLCTRSVLQGIMHVHCVKPNQTSHNCALPDTYCCSVTRNCAKQPNLRYVASFYSCIWRSHALPMYYKMSKYENRVVSTCWHVISGSTCYVTMETTGILLLYTSVVYVYL